MQCADREVHSARNKNETAAIRCTRGSSWMVRGFSQTFYCYNVQLANRQQNRRQKSEKGAFGVGALPYIPRSLRFFEFGLFFLRKLQYGGITLGLREFYRASGILQRISELFLAMLRQRQPVIGR
jgi:hypothetical protein